MIGKTAQFIAGAAMVALIIGWVLTVVALIAGANIAEITFWIIIAIIAASYIYNPLGKKVRPVLARMMKWGRIFFMVSTPEDRRKA